MTEEREKYLVENFPLIYKKEEGSNDPYSLFGFECGDGWFRILYWLSKHIQNKIDQNNRWAEKYPDQYKKIEQVKAVQVKEKFGGLRFYYCGGDEQISAVVSFVEEISYSICETTGKFEDVGHNTKGWIKTHHAELSKSKDFKFVDDEELRKLNLGNN